jgi:hypothetical protein
MDEVYVFFVEDLLEFPGKLPKNFPGNFPQYNSTAIFEEDAAWAGFFTNLDSGRRLPVARN